MTARFEILFPHGLNLIVILEHRSCLGIFYAVFLRSAEHMRDKICIHSLALIFGCRADEHHFKHIEFLLCEIMKHRYPAEGKKPSLRFLHSLKHTRHYNTEAYRLIVFIHDNKQKIGLDHGDKLIFI